MNDVRHRVRPHTADLILEVYGPTREAALAEAVRALAATYAEPQTDERVTVAVSVSGTTDAEVLVGVLDETIYLADTRGLVAVDADLGSSEEAVSGTFTTVPVTGVEVIGAVPKAVARTDLAAGPDRDGGWWGRVTVDV